MSADRRVRRGAVRRSEDAGLVRGATRFLEDVGCPDALHAVFVRSPFAHARILSIDASEALQTPGVRDVVTSAHLSDLRMPVEDLPDHLRRPVLAGDVVRFVGEPLAVVLAETRAAATDAAESVSIDYDPLPVVLDPLEAMGSGAPLLFPEHGTNVATVLHDPSDPGALEDAEVRIRGRFRNQRVAPAPLEVNGALAVPEDGGLTLWVPTQAPHFTREAIADVLGVDEASIRVRTAAVGGGFGAKFPTYPEQAVVAALALRLGVPVRYTETRSENLVAMTHGRDQIQDVELGATRDGRLTGMRIRIVADIGGYADLGPGIPSSTALMACGPYVVPRVDVEIRTVLTNKTPVGAYRGAGRPEATAMIERAMDMLAAEIGMDPAEIRRCNFITDFPHRTPTGADYDTGDYARALDEVLRIVDYDALRSEQRARRGHPGRALLGIGIGSYVEVTGWGSEYARVTVEADGSVTVITGASPQGQGHETALAQIVADRMWVPFDAVTVRHSDTGLVPRGSGTAGSRTLQVAGSAVLGAADIVVEQARHLAADLLEVAAEDVVLHEGVLSVAGAPDSDLTWADLARAAAEAAKGGDAGHPALDAEHDFEIEDSTYPFGTHVAVVEVDPETGNVSFLRHVALDDCGVVLNPMLVEGQIHGGVAQGASQALFEEVVFDGSGAPLTSNLSTYAFPSASDLPGFDTASTETPTPRNPMGAKGVGEGGTTGAMPAVQNAVVDALAHLGVRHVDMPTTPERVWRAIVAARSTP